MKNKYAKLIPTFFLIFSLNAIAEENFDVMAKIQNDYKNELDMNRPLAESGDSDAQNKLGEAYYFGRGTHQDFSEAAKWFKKAVKQGNVTAKQNLRDLEIDMSHPVISMADFQLDAKSMKTGKKLAIIGFLEFSGNLVTLANYPEQAHFNQYYNIYKVLLLTENSPRDARKDLIELQNFGCGKLTVCKRKIYGHVTPCSETFMGKRIRDTQCLVVDGINKSAYM